MHIYPILLRPIHDWRISYSVFSFLSCVIMEYDMSMRSSLLWEPLLKAGCSKWWSKYFWQLHISRDLLFTQSWQISTNLLNLFFLATTAEGKSSTFSLYYLHQYISTLSIWLLGFTLGFLVQVILKTNFQDYFQITIQEGKRDELNWMLIIFEVSKLRKDFCKDNICYFKSPNPPWRGP